MSSNRPVLLWFRQDLRLSDNPALSVAVATGQPVIPVYIHDTEGHGDWPPGGAAQWWLHHSLSALAASLEARGSQLILRSGRARDVLCGLIAETGASKIFWNRCYEPAAIARDRALKAELPAFGCAVESHSGNLLREPWEPKTQSGAAFKVFSPFFRALSSLGPAGAPLPAPEGLNTGSQLLASERLADWALTPSRPNWARGFEAVWTPGEAGAQRRLQDFLDRRVATYAQDRDRPDGETTSRLSPHLHFGEITPSQIWHATTTREAGRGHQKFLSEVGWREFSYHLLYHQPQLPHDNLRPEFERFPWREDAAAFQAWSKGQTGVPIVDAGMRELWTTGWMHNRVRMIVASFLVKNLGIHWREGKAWFWDTLVDADLANNAASWQWVAGCGADAAPYFRVFNPVLQGLKFDPDGLYVRRWVPELSKMPSAHIHAPWSAGASILADAGVKLGLTYPAPIVDLSESRARALAAFAQLKTQVA
ncbi:MAG TPA: deoxyribodipyrimidine photolyase [Alphaproteobacteria bacterium]|nr:deoxyribodipyrimidine photolyase [Alphaproteobacteria bacterium]HAJ47711.1 deoxyribodipyrimidine photolyase [Alphaproteobacteria bacterium]